MATLSQITMVTAKLPAAWCDYYSITEVGSYHDVYGPDLAVTKLALNIQAMQGFDAFTKQNLQAAKKMSQQSPIRKVIYNERCV